MKRKGAAASKKKGKVQLRTRISTPLIWIAKYLLRAQKQMPTMTMPRAVRSFKPHPKKRHLTLGSCCKKERTITLATHTTAVRVVKKRRKIVQVPLSHLEILQTLAHELSHMAYEKHGYEQEWYGRTIFNTFGLVEPCPHCGGKGRMPARYEND
ncbi:MAG TPA: hypothetical protein PLZ86_05035 [bacterium]|nr:hypothetical protein [bacterium]